MKNTFHQINCYDGKELISSTIVNNKPTDAELKNMFTCLIGWIEVVPLRYTKRYKLKNNTLTKIKPI